ncbi:MAG: DegT/DnrJ/EryC1/StrS family aminotransferase [Magnetococcales bacterium]|nr:DegT/DnrJ/EryC1/StrS family aminotransferase [Magnetococcales bacterium]
MEVEPIQFVNLSRQHLQLGDKINRAIASVIDSSSFIRGTQVTTFEQKFSQLHNDLYAIGVNSGTDALHLAMRALEIGPGDEVITVPNSWISTSFAISYVGATPVFVDINQDTGQMDVTKLAQAITDKTKAVIPVHLFGHPAPMDEIVKLCRPQDIHIIEDVAQAPLAKLGDKVVGTFGDIACYSFYPGKNLGCLGDGGLILTKNSAIATTIKQLANYGQKSPYKHNIIGFNSRLDTIQAAVLLCKLPFLEQWNAQRQAIAKQYDTAMSQLGVSYRKQPENATSVYHLYVVEVQNRNACLAFLRNNGVMAQVHYPEVLHLQECYQKLGYRVGDMPVAENAAKTILSLPIYPGMTDDEVSRVIAILSHWLKKQSQVTA